MVGQDQLGVFLSMRVDVIPIKELSENLKKDWLKIQASDPSLSGPFFHPELFASVGKYCPDIYLALLYKENVLTGILPYLKDQKLKKAQRIEFCDFEAIISYPGQDWDMNMILKKTGLNSWDFNALVNFDGIKTKTGDFKGRHAFRIDLACGLEAYWAYIKSKKVKFKSLLVDRRILEEKVGPLRFVADCRDEKILRQLLQWKISHHNRDQEWAKLASNLLEHIYHLNDPLFRGVLSALYAGDELLAANFVIRQHDKLGGVITTFNPNFTKFSTGLILLHELINAHKSVGFNILDMGAGATQYKQDYSNSFLPTIYGRFESDSIKSRIKSVHWLYQGLLPIAKLKGKIINKISNPKQDL